MLLGRWKKKFPNKGKGQHYQITNTYSTLTLVILIASISILSISIKFIILAANFTISSTIVFNFYSFEQVYFGWTFDRNLLNFTLIKKKVYCKQLYFEIFAQWCWLYSLFVRSTNTCKSMLIYLFFIFFIYE